MTEEDPYFIPSVPQYCRDLNVELDDTIGDDFFNQSDAMIHRYQMTPKILASTNQQQSQRLARSVVQPKLSVPPANATSNTAPPQKTTTRRSLMKRPLSIASQPDNAQNIQPVVEEQKPPVNVAPAKAPLTRFQAMKGKAAGVFRSTSVEPKLKPTVTTAIGTPVKAIPPKNTTRRSLMKHPLPVASQQQPDNAENVQPMVEEQKPPVNVAAPTKAPLTRFQTMKGKAAGVFRGTTSVESKPKSLATVAAIGTPVKAIPSKNKRRSYMDPTIASTSKLTATTSTSKK